MARAFLRLSDGLKAAFTAAQEDQGVRYLRVELDPQREDTLTVVGTGPRGSVDADFDGLQEVVEESKPCVLLFALSPDDVAAVTGRSAQGSSTLWVLVAWVPDDSKVRHKMLYSSSKQDLREGLGLGFFEGEFYANVKADISFEGLCASRRSLGGDQLLSDAELMKRELNKQERESALRSTAMGFIPFAVSDELREALSALTNLSVNWVEMCMDGEQIALVGARRVPADGSLQPFLSDVEPRFILPAGRRQRGRGRGQRRGQGCRRGRGWGVAKGRGDEMTTLFIYHCPEESPVRLKMTYSSSKASVAAAAAQAGVKVDKTIRGADEIDEAVAHVLCGDEDGALEIRGANEIDEAIAHVLRGEEDGAGAGGQGGIGGGSGMGAPPR